MSGFKRNNLISDDSEDDELDSSEIENEDTSVQNSISTNESRKDTDLSDADIEDTSFPKSNSKNESRELDLLEIENGDTSIHNSISTNESRKDTDLSDAEIEDTSFPKSNSKNESRELDLLEIENGDTSIHNSISTNESRKDTDLSDAEIEDTSFSKSNSNNESRELDLSEIENEDTSIQNSVLINESNEKSGSLEAEMKGKFFEKNNLSHESVEELGSSKLTIEDTSHESVDSLQIVFESTDKTTSEKLAVRGDQISIIEDSSDDTDIINGSYQKDVSYIPESDNEASYCEKSLEVNSSLGLFSSAKGKMYNNNEASNIVSSKDNSIDANECHASFLSNHSARSQPSGSVSLNSNDSLNSLRLNKSGDDSRSNTRSTLEREISDKTDAYNNLLKAVRSCDPKKLKDGGRLLNEKIKTCKGELLELLARRSNSPEQNVSLSPNASNSLFSTKDQGTSHLGKKGLETHRIQQALTVDSLVTLHSSLKTCPSANVLETDPKGLKVELMPHQKHALAWLLWREQQKPRGGILADDMGLGKTLTMISLVLKSEEYKSEEEKEAWLSNESSRCYPGKTLVVCPASLIGQWESQIKQHCKKNILQVLIHHGKPRELQAKRLARYDIVLTTYGVIAEENKVIHHKNRKGPLFRVSWERVILDEAHVIRNHKTQKAEAACELESKFRWCLTGTPVHNKELDVYSLLKFLRCSPFDDLTIWKRWVDKNANGGERLNTVMKSILLRRTKENLKELGELQDLPTKEAIPMYIDLDEEELKVYHQVLHFSKSLLSEYILQRQQKAGYVPESMKYIHNKIKNAGDIKTTEIFVLLLRLRQICCLPSLIESLLDKEVCKEEGIEDPILGDLFAQVKRLSISTPATLRQENLDEENVLVESNPVFNPNRISKKIQTVLDIVKEISDTEDKIVIVSQWTGILKKLHSHLKSLKVGVVTLDGSVPVKDRGSLVDAFNLVNSGPKIMLLSLNAGGVGLNLIGGNRLIIFEPHWNPQLESQACDRIYRVGQKKKVYIYKIICKDTIEERIENLQKKKLELASNVLKGEVKREMSKLSLQDLITLFDVKS